MQFNGYWNDAAHLFSGQGMDVMTNVMTDEVSPLPWTSWDEVDSGSFSLDDERFLLDALSHLTDEEFEESAPSSPSSSHSSPSSSHSSPALLPEPQHSQISTSIPRKVKMSGTRRRLCQRPECKRVDRGRGLCGAHGGGKRCFAKFCGKASRKYGLCTFHFRFFYDENPVTSKRTKQKH